MFGKRLTLFRLFGFPIKVDLSWVLIFILVTASLSSGMLPAMYPKLAPWVYWALGAAGALALFASVVFHELCHALVARRFGLAIEGITLFLFGGVAEMEDEPANAKAEALMAAAGPAASVILGLGLLGLWQLGKLSGWPPPLAGTVGYIGLMNLALAAFNLIPGFPLDGGRILRSALWHWKQDLRWATAVASRLGAGLGVALMVLGFLSMLLGSFIGGIWYVLIGAFLRAAARGAYQRTLLRQSLLGQAVSQFMVTEPVTVSPQTPVAELVRDYFYRRHHRLYPVTEGRELLGCVGVRHIRSVPRADWPRRAVAEVMEPCSPENTISPEADALQAFARMSRSQSPRLMVVDGDRRLVGIVALSDLTSVLDLRAELGDI